MELNREQIDIVLKALEACADEQDCSECTYTYGDDNCLESIGKAVTIIKYLLKMNEELTEENERLRAEVRKLNIITDKTDVALYAYQHLFDIRADTVRQFAERLKANAYTESTITGYRYMVVAVEDIDQIATEMLEGK